MFDAKYGRFRTGFPAGRHTLRLLPMAACLTAACFPTMQTARIDPGLHLDVGITYLGDQVRNDEQQGVDLMAYVAPSLGIGDRVEIGLPIGLYLEEGLESLGSEQFGESPRTLVAWPYVKTALLSRDSPHHLAAIVQGAWLFPANLGIRYGRDLGSWEPYAGVSLIFSAGPAGDDPFVTRYQEAGQTIVTASVGATWETIGRPAVEVGLMRNHYREGAVYGDFGQPTTPRTLYDLYVAARFRLLGGGRGR